MTAPRRKKVYPQMVAIELILVAVAAVAVYFLLPLAGASHEVAMFFAGAVADRLLILVLRHRNKPAGWKIPVTVTRGPARRKTSLRKP